MDRETIIRLAREAGLPYMYETGDVANLGLIERFADLVAKAERERILEMCKEGWWDGEGIRYHLGKQDAIRSRT